MKKSASVLFLMVALASCGKAPSLDVDGAWTRDTVGGTANAAVFMTIKSTTPDRLTAASSPVAKKTDLMTMESGRGSMRMRYVKLIEIPAGVEVNLDPRGLHVWLADLNEPLQTGQTFPLVLEFEKAGQRRVNVAVIAPAATPPS